MTKIICDMCGKEIVNEPTAVRVKVKSFNPMCVEKELHYCTSCKEEMLDTINDNIGRVI